MYNHIIIYVYNLFCISTPHIFVLATVYILLYSHCIRRKEIAVAADTRRRRSIRCGGMVDKVYGLSGVE
jgi:hypothetical protein